MLLFLSLQIITLFKKLLRARSIIQHDERVAAQNTNRWCFSGKLVVVHELFLWETEAFSAVRSMSKQVKRALGIDCGKDLCLLLSGMDLRLRQREACLQPRHPSALLRADQAERMPISA